MTVCAPTLTSRHFLCAFQSSDGSYTGFIQVHLRLSRPVTVPAVEAANSEGASSQTGSRCQAPSECQEGPDCEPSDRRTSFYLPSDCVKQLHIRSLTTTREVIQGLLKKFMVLDNPRKFALYRQMHRDGQGAETTLTAGFLKKKNFIRFGKHMYETTLNEKFFPLPFSFPCRSVPEASSV